MKLSLKILLLLFVLQSFGQNADSIQLRTIYDFNLSNSSCHSNLKSLCKDVGHRLSGSQSAQLAVEWAELLMQNTNLDSVYLQPLMVPHWVRGDVGLVYWKNKKGEVFQTNCTALGGSVGTNGVIKGDIIEINSWDQLEEYGKEKITGKIVFLIAQ